MQALADRTVLLFTGVQRMARDILEHVVGRYLARERAAMEIVTRLKAGAEAMCEDVRAGDLDGFADRLAQYWMLKQCFDPAANHPRIEAIVEPHLRDLQAWELPGAGGGGFVFMLARRSIIRTH